MMRLLAGLLCALFVGNAACAAVDVKALHAGKGEEVWYVCDHTLPMIAMTASLPAGSVYDPAGKAGLAGFAASLLDEGAGPYDSTAFQTALSNRAIRLSVSVERDDLVISLVTLSDNARDAFRLLGIALSHPRFDPDAVARVRGQILQSLLQDNENPPTVAAKVFFKTWFHDHPYAHPVYGEATPVGAITANDLKDFAASHWARGGLRIAVAGDTDAATLAGLLNSAFGRLPLKAAANVPAPVHPGQPGVQIIPLPVPQPTVVFGLPGILRSDRDFIPAYVANYILGGGGFSARLTGEVRVKRGLTYDISTSLDSLRHSGFVSGEFATKASSVHDAIDRVRATMKDFSENGPSPQELADAKTYLTGSFPLAFSSNTGIANQLNSFQRQGLPMSYVARRNALIDAVTLDEVKRAAKRLFSPAAMTVVIAGSPASSTGAGPPPVSGK
jgi:zinc protease